MNKIISNPDQIAEWVYQDSFYPNTYRILVADSHAKKDQYRDIVKHLPIPENGQSIDILEPGPSNVPLLKNAIQEIGLPIVQYRLTGLDKFPRMYPAELEMLSGSVTAIPLPNSSVDVVVMSSVLFFVSDQQQAIDECSRVLKPGGQLILSEPDIEQGTILTELVFAYELEAIRTATLTQNSGGLDKLLYCWRIIKTIIPRIPYLIPVIFINKRILAQHKGGAGFTEAHLIKLLTTAHLTVIAKARTYANAYFLLVSQKEA
jgi:SAM-dependent methyltransferase